MRAAVYYSCLLLLLGSLAACQPSDDDVKKKVAYKGPISETSNLTTLYSDSARLQIKLMAPLQLQFESGDGVYPKGVNMIFYDKKGTVTNTVRANYGKYIKQKDIYFIRGNVILKNEVKNETMRTEELHWDKQKREIFTDKFVTIQTGTEILKGHGLTASQDFSRYKILKPTGVFSLQNQ
jgi:LPS export ABC transporter protein LptC